MGASDRVADEGLRVAHRRLRAARGTLWMAILLSFGYATAKTAGDVGQQDAFSLDVIVRGIGPLVLLAAGYALSPVKRRGVTVVELAFALFGFACLASTFWSVAPQATLLKSIQFMVTMLVLARLSRLYDTFEEAVRALVGIIYLLLIAGAAQFLAFPASTYVTASIYDTEPRLSIVLPAMSPNPLSALCVAGLLSLLFRLGPRWVYKYRFLSAILGAVFLAELAATRTRTALAIGLLLALCGAVANAAHRTTPVVFGGLGIAALSLWSWTPDRQDAILRFLLRGQDSRGTQTLTGRTDIWTLALDRWADDPFLGFGYYAGHRVGIPGLGENQSNLDSVWIETLVDVGIFGIIPLATAVVVGSFALLRHHGCRSAESMFACLLAVYGLLASFVNPTVQTPGIGLLLFGLPLFLVNLKRAGEATGG